MGQQTAHTCATKRGDLINTFTLIYSVVIIQTVILAGLGGFCVVMKDKINGGSFHSFNKKK